ncbi:MAG: helix-turn-helix domain-containing protein [Chloroflexota bacterium]|jgi:transcriptional regulator with XRE-family HTH domain|nr:helix-turn-helix domain-containing protein [Chloroflexota bacterium]
MERVMVALKDTLKRERRRAALTQEELAREAGVGIMTIRRIESGDITEPRVSTLRKLAAALGISTRELVEE